MVETPGVDPDLSEATASPREDTQVGVRRAFERTFEPGQIVFDVEEPGDHVYVIQAGCVDLVRPGPGAPRVVARLAPGDLFGEMGPLLGAPRTVRAVAAEETRLLELDGSTFQAMCLERPEIALGVIERLAARVIELEARLARTGIDDVLRPVVRYLVRRAERGEVSARVRTTLREIARGASLPMLEAHRALQHLFERRLVRLVDDTLIVPDLEALTASLDPAA